MFFKNLFTKQVSIKICSIVFLGLIYILLYKILIPRITAFGCMDDCNNFMGGYFLLHGKMLFSQIFFNHAPFMAHVSAFVQFFTHPQNLFELILRHRQFLLLFAFVSEAILLIRFGPIVIPFALLYELSKFYLAGDRFLAEGFIVYPFVYLIGIIFKKFLNKRLYTIDYIIAAISVWFIVFMREPYSIAALLLFASLLWNITDKKQKMISVGVFIVFTLITLFSYNIREFYYNVIFVNQTTIAAENADSGFLSGNIYKSFLYPIIIFFQGEWNFIRYIEMGIAAIFLFTNALFAWKRKWRFLIFLWIFLGVSNLRLVRPGHEYYGAFHLLPWYAMTIFISLLMLWQIYSWKKLFSYIGFTTFVGIILFLIFSKGSYIHDRIDQQTEFITNYGNVLQVGNVVSALSSTKDTLFVDGYDDTVYLVAHRYSPYKYSWYTSLMPMYKKYTDARLQMFAQNPPDFYYGSCPKEKAPYYLLPTSTENLYTRLYNLKDPSCLWIKKTKLVTISDSQWTRAGESLYFLQPTER